MDTIVFILRILGHIADLSVMLAMLWWLRHLDRRVSKFDRHYWDD